MNKNLLLSIANKNKDSIIQLFIDLGLTKDEASLITHADYLKISKEKTMRVLKIDEIELMKRYNNAVTKLRELITPDKLIEALAKPDKMSVEQYIYLSRGEHHDGKRVRRSYF